ncbi:hypothetical protein [Pseudomonas viridiflava]|uniref:Uncharacterized protein n=1 Tax=Pseudomonas viridiflava TaxID=33069 RepID=A0AA46VSH8_PSEVI|nr:hypothetical protein [Pseudomonas viridiflava]UZA66848.1 hypothetical protein EZZ81_00800 [Pseudomonas viridiflava]
MTDSNQQLPTHAPPLAEGNCEAGDQPTSKPTITSVQFDIAQGNSYRMELGKTMLAIATGLLAFTIAFPPTLTKITFIESMQIAWLCLALSIIGGLVNMYGWEKFYLTYRLDFHRRGSLGKTKRKRVTRWRVWGRGVQFAGLFIGVIGIGIFAYCNLPNIKLAV